MNKTYSRALYWFTHDLRLLDNLSLHNAQQQSEAICYCYVIDKNSLVRGRYGMPSMGQPRFSFIWQSLQDLKQQLEQAGHQLLIRVGEPLDEISRLISLYQPDAVFAGLQNGVYERRRWQQLQKQFRFVDFNAAATSTLLNEHELPFEWDNFPVSFSKFRKQVEPLSARFPAKSEITPDFSHRSLPPMAVAPLDDYQQLPDPWISGGESAAQQHLQRYFASSAPSTYKQTRNALDGFDQSTKMSAYLAQGNLSPQQVINQLRDYEAAYGENDSTYWIAFELLWREYFFWYLLRYQEKVFAVGGINNNKPQTSFYPARFKQWCCGTTPYPLVNACMKQLYETGYLSNRGRQIVASCLVNELSIDWRYGAAYFEQQLLDYDIGSNWGNWQYIAGVGADPRGGRHFNLDKQSRQFDADGEFVERWNGHTTRALDSTDAADWPVS